MRGGAVQRSQSGIPGPTLFGPFPLCPLAFHFAPPSAPRVLAFSSLSPRGPFDHFPIQRGSSLSARCQGVPDTALFACSLPASAIPFYSTGGTHSPIDSSTAHSDATYLAESAGPDDRQFTWSRRRSVVMAPPSEFDPNGEQHPRSLASCCRLSTLLSHCPFRPLYVHLHLHLHRTAHCQVSTCCNPQVSWASSCSMGWRQTLHRTS